MSEGLAVDHGLYPILTMDPTHRQTMKLPFPEKERKSKQNFPKVKIAKKYILERNIFQLESVSGNTRRLTME